MLCKGGKNLNYLVCVDSFKGSLSSYEAGKAICEGIEKKGNKTVLCPMADGGEGTTQALSTLEGAVLREIYVSNPLMRKIKCEYVIINKTLAVMEMASACGLYLISKNEQNPLYTTTYGLGEMIIDALNQGIRDFIIGIGGSSTNDGGSGMLSALGVNLLDKEGKNVRQGNIGLSDLEAIDITGIDKRIKESKFQIACDVKNTLLGKNGATYVFSKQKGARDEDLPKLEESLKHFGDKTKQLLPEADYEKEGTGAAGGLGFGLLAYLNAKLSPGAELIIERTGIEEKIKNCDVVVTGEGKLDSQSLMGKAPYTVAMLGKKYNKKTVAVCGIIEKSDKLNEVFDLCVQTKDEKMSTEEAMQRDNAIKACIKAGEKVAEQI